MPDMNLTPLSSLSIISSYQMQITNHIMTFLSVFSFIAIYPPRHFRESEHDFL